MRSLLAPGLVVALLMGAGVASAADASPAPSMVLSDMRPVEVENARLVSMSPDGRLLAAAEPSTDYRHGRLCVYAFSTMERVSCAELSKLDAGLRMEDVTWSPDSSMLAFSEQGLVNYRDGDLWLMDVATGTLTDIDDDGFSGRLPVLDPQPTEGLVSLPVNPAFSPDGRTVAFSRSLIKDGKPAGDEIAIVPVSGGEPTRLVEVSPGELGVVYFGIHWAPDGEHIYYSVQFAVPDDPRNGIWVVDADGSDARLLVAGGDELIRAPAVLAVSSTGTDLLAYYPRAFGDPASPGPLYTLVDTQSGALDPIDVLTPGAPDYSQISLAAFSPDGRSLLTVSRLVDPDFQVAVRALHAGTETPLVPQGLESAGPTERGITPTWSANGTVFLTGGPQLGAGTLLAIEGGTDGVPPPPTPFVSPSPGAGAS